MASFLDNLLTPFQRDIPVEDQPEWELGGSAIEEELEEWGGSEVEDEVVEEWGGSNTAARAAPVARMRGGFRSKILEASDFRHTNQFTYGQWTAVASFEMPPGAIMRIEENSPFRMFIKNASWPASLNAATATARTLSLPHLMRTSQLAPALPSAHHPEVVIVATVGAVDTNVQVTAIDYGARTVTFTEPAHTTVLTIYYTTGVGEWRFRVSRAAGVSDTVAITVANGSMAALHSVDQTNRETAHRWPQLVTLVRGQHLLFEVLSSVNVNFNPLARQMVLIPSLMGLLDVNDPAALADIAEAGLRA